MPDPNRPAHRSIDSVYGFSRSAFAESRRHLLDFDAIQTYGLFVGIEQYKKALAQELEFTVDDARAIHRAFDSRTGPKDLRLITEEQASRDAILNTLNAFLRLAQKGDLLILYLAAHATIRHNDFFFLPWDADMHNVLGTGISSTLLLNALSTAAKKGVKVIFFLDTCQSGGMAFDLSRYQSKEGGGIACMVAAASTEMSYPYREKGHGYFSYFLAEGLNGKADETGDGYISLRGLFDYVYVNVIRQVKEDRTDGKRQSPQLTGTLSGDTVLHYHPPGPSGPPEE